MAMELYERLIDEYAELGGGRVGLTPTVGDPLVDRRIIERIRYARSKPEITEIAMFSNMISLGLVGAEALVESGINVLSVSTSGLDEAMYKRVYRSTRYRQVLANIKAFADANIAAGSPVHFTIEMRSDRPLSEVVKYPDYRELADVIGADKIAGKFRYDSWAGKIRQKDLIGTMKLRTRTPPRVSPCSELFTGPMVYWDGRVGACGCRDVNASELIIGDANRERLGEIWFGHAIERLRDDFVTSRIRPICDSCTHYNNVSIVLAWRNRRNLDALVPARWPSARPG
jgi:MoaA/NifB/PqqE/SkfB family radical SAM enzyme